MPIAELEKYKAQVSKARSSSISSSISSSRIAAPLQRSFTGVLAPVARRHLQAIATNSRVLELEEESEALELEGGSEALECEKDEESSPAGPSAFEIHNLLMQVCDETSNIAEVELKVGTFSLRVKREIGKPAPAPKAVAAGPPVLGQDMAEYKSADGAPSAPSKSTKLAKGAPSSASKAAVDGGSLFVTSPKVGVFRQGRTVKGKSGPPLCAEGQVVKKGQVVCYLEQLGTQQPVEAQWGEGCHRRLLKANCITSASSSSNSLEAQCQELFTFLRRQPCFSSAFAMPSTRWLVLRLLLLVAFFLACHQAELVAASEASLYDRRPCEAAVAEWSSKEKLALNKEVQLVEEGGVKILDLLFFLHIPRTGGRTYHQCFLKNLYLPKDRCPRSYDTLRLDLSQPSCKLLSSHDDMSILNKMSTRTSVVTNIRNPVDRVLSTYEFSVEVAARFLRLKSINTSRSPLPRAKSPSQLVSTLTIWPWKFLVPFMQHDIFARRDARREGKVDWPSSTNTTYDAPTITMPLTEFIHHPVAHELVHNGATFQVAGLTNNSYEEGAFMIRKCISLYPKLGYQVLDVAKRRLDSMLFVGLTEKHQESATTFFSLVGDQVQVQSEALKGILDQNASVPVQEKDPPKLLLAAYKSCLASLRSSHAVRRTSTLQLISPVKYSLAERNLIPSSVVDEIVSLNELDMELHKHAKFLFAKQQGQFTTSTLPQDKEGQALVLSTFLALCITMSILLLGFALILRVRNRVGNDRIPFWLRRLAFMQAHEKL